ncbi:NFX1-type zinc finger-containing protein 1 isoform X2 [Paralichthys olivaceus]|uniref:NFX1-type zinc finger-containing protein 1 isoform X2 n=1 Tax=Paralichthys olivaceus TaxID=8255 RepID=UPI003753AD80
MERQTSKNRRRGLDNGKETGQDTHRGGGRRGAGQESEETGKPEGMRGVGRGGKLELLREADRCRGRGGRGQTQGGRGGRGQTEGGRGGRGQTEGGRGGWGQTQGGRGGRGQTQGGRGGMGQTKGDMGGRGQTQGGRGGRGQAQRGRGGMGQTKGDMGGRGQTQGGRGGWGQIEEDTGGGRQENGVNVQRGDERYAGGCGRQSREGRNRGDVAKRLRGGLGTNGATRGITEMGVRRGGHSVDGREGMGDERRGDLSETQKRNRGRSESTRAGATQGRRLGYKALEELSEKDPSLVAIALSSDPALQDVLCETTMRQDLVELLCLALSKAFKSQRDRGSLQQLANIIKDSGFFRTVLPHYLVGMGSEFNPLRRAQYPQHLENILVILSKVLSIFPSSSIQTVSLLLTMLQCSMNNLSASGVVVQTQMEERVEGLQELVRHLEKSAREGKLHSKRDTYALLTSGDNTGEEEKEDFCKTPICPTPEELLLQHRPFLRRNTISQCYPNTHIFLDTHFRLLREDFVGPLRDGIQQLLWNQTDKGNTDKKMKTKNFDNIHLYFDTKLVTFKCTHNGISHIVQFDIQPLKSVRWENSKRLLYGSLVCLSCDNCESFLFATVSDRTLKDLHKGKIQITFTEESRLKLAGLQADQVFLMVESIAFFEAYRYVLQGLQEQGKANLPFQRYIVECSTDVQPPAYLKRQDKYDLSSVAMPKYEKSMKPFHSLKAEAWPRMEELGLDESQLSAIHLALTKELAIIQGPPGTGKTYVGLKIARALLTNPHLWSEESGSGTVLVVCYTNHALDQFLEGIYTFLKKGIVRVGGCSKSEILKPFNLRELRHSVKIRQMLPSHLRFAFGEIMKQLRLDEKNVVSESIKLKCSTKGILRENILQKFISRTHWISLQRPSVKDFFFETRKMKSSLIMEWLSLGATVFLQRETEIAKKNEDEEVMELMEEDLIEIEEEADLILAERIIDDDIGPRQGRDRRKELNMALAIREVEELMLVMNLDEAEIQAEQSEEGWEMQREQRIKLKNNIRKELQNTSAMTEEEAEKVFDIWTLSLSDRWRLYRLWLERYRLELRSTLLAAEQAYQNTVERLADVKQHESLCILKKAKVIGMTTTGAAKYRTILQEVRPCLVIVEEAAQVLEAHTITTLNQACQHLILIGDHQQLQPSVTVYELAKNFNMEISMFERLVKMGLPFVRLTNQHRMRPEIARLLTPHIYAELENHPSVFQFDNIKGLNTNLFFVEHEHPEHTDGTSRQNQHEATFVVALCRYLLLQEYKPEQITILTTYMSQLNCLRNLMPARQFSGVRVHVVDKYQGEENDIILLSLVRSNVHGKVGFLSIPNRVCVALSRARKGLYFVGNSATLETVKLWSNIFHTLEENNQIGKALTLCCQNHPDRQVEAACAKDFEQAPEGGCTQPCLFRLDCGHVCASVCHPYDPEHKMYKCNKNCEKILCDQGHKCPLVCHKECPEECPVRVKKIIPQCQHSQMVPCHQDPETFECKVPCQKTLLCGHPCVSTCGGPCTKMCDVKVTLKLKCGHSQEGACFYQTVEEKPDCLTPCQQQLKCGHPCRGNCTRCYQGRFHYPCFQRCERVLVCSHKCKKPCFLDGSPCQRPCDNCCVHSKCMKPCGQPCTLCTEPCVRQCPHQSCRKLCHEPCDHPPCTQPCAKTLDCGHQCIGLCGDKCPSKCRVCNESEVKEIFFGTEGDPQAHFVQLEDCRHIFEYSEMDKYMGVNDNEQANPGVVAITLKRCPRCQTPVRNSLRYRSHINCNLAGIEMVKVKIIGNPPDVKKHKEALKKMWKENSNTCKMLQPHIDQHISGKLKEHVLTADDLWVLEYQMDFLTRVVKLQMKSTKIDVAEFWLWLSDLHQKFTDQQVFDLQRQLLRLTFLTDLHVHCHEAKKRGKSDHIQSEVQTITEVLEKSGQFTEQDEQRVKETMEGLKQKLPFTGVLLSEEETTMKMPSGHWYKCPKGHVYLTTECGEAVERRWCPHCDATIVG